MNKPKVIDLFCGCGGLSYGFVEAGYEVVLGIDHFPGSKTSQYKQVVNAVLGQI